MLILCKQWFVRYLVTLFALLTVAFFVIEYSLFQMDLYIKFIDFIDGLIFIRTEEVEIAIGFIAISIAIDQMRMIRRRRRKSALDAERLAAARSTMATVHDTVNNALNNLLLVKLEADKGEALKPETLILFGQLIDGMAADLRLISDLDTVSERTLSEDISVLTIPKR